MALPNIKAHFLLVALAHPISFQSRRFLRLRSPPSLCPRNHGQIDIQKPYCFHRFILLLLPVSPNLFLSLWFFFCRLSSAGTVDATSTAVDTSSSSAAPTAVNAAPRYFSQFLFPEFVNILVWINLHIIVFCI